MATEIYVDAVAYYPASGASTISGAIVVSNEAYLVASKLGELMARMSR